MRFLYGPKSVMLTTGPANLPTGARECTHFHTGLHAGSPIVIDNIALWGIDERQFSIRLIARAPLSHFSRSSPPYL